MTNTDTSRAGFEEWAKREFSEYFEDDGESMFDRASSNKYNNLLLRNALAPFQAGAAWQAASTKPTTENSSAVEPQIDGYPLWSGLPPPVMSDERIRDIFMRNGFTIKEGQSDLKPYVYAAARALMSAQSTDAVDTAKKAKEIDRLPSSLPPITQPLIAEAARDDVRKMDTDESRVYLWKFMRDNFSDTTFSRYIKHELAGDFAYQMANAIAVVKRDDVDVDDKYQPPTELECDEFRRTPGSFNDMIRAIHSAGYHRYAGAANKAFGAHYSAKYDAAIASMKRDDVGRGPTWLDGLGRAIGRACDELPDGADLHIEIEHGAGLARLYMPPQGDDDSGWVKHDWDGDTFADQINRAIDAAIAASKKDAPSPR